MSIVTNSRPDLDGASRSIHGGENPTAVNPFHQQHGSALRSFTMAQRLFLAVRPSDDAATTLRSLHRKDAQGVRFVPPENWHVTLRFLGQAEPTAVIDAMRHVLLPPARARMGPAVDVLHQRALVVPVSGVDPLAAVVGAATREVGDPVPRRPYSGHITVARLKRTATMPRILGERVHAEWDVNQIELIVSRLHPDGVEYEAVHTWRLSDDTA